MGIKDATGDLARVSEHNSLIEGQQFIQLAGNDQSALGHLAMGGAGCISVTANVLPAECAAMHTAYHAGDLAGARKIADRLITLHNALFCSPSPGPAKYALSRMGLCSDDVRLPITKPDAAARAQIDAALDAAGVKV